MARKTTSLVAVLWLLLVAEMGVQECRGWADEAVDDLKDNVSELSEKANLDEKADTVKEGASEVYNDAKDTAESWSNWAYDKFSKGFGLKEEEVKETAHYMVDKAGDAAVKTTQRINSAASDGSNYASEKAGEVGKAAASFVSENVPEGAKANYEAAKEKASQGAGEVGAKMREKTAEL